MLFRLGCAALLWLCLATSAFAASRTISGTLVRPNGTAWSGGVLTVTLTTTFSNVGQTVVPQTWRVTASASGAVSLTILVPDTGAAVYTFALPDGTSTTATLGAGATVLLETIFTSAIADPTAETELTALVSSVGNPLFVNVAGDTMTGALLGTSATFSGTITGGLFSGSGASLTALNASVLATGTVPDARFPATLPAAIIQPTAYTIATLPAAGTAGRIVRVTDGIRGLWVDNGTSWASLTGQADVKDFGAVGDGVADDVEEIQLAIDTVSALLTDELSQSRVPRVPGVYGPYGKYRLSSSLLITAPVVFTGAGINSTVLAIDGNHPGITIKGRLLTGSYGWDHKPLISNLTIIGDDNAANTSQYCLAVISDVLNSMPRVNIQRVALQFCHYGLYVNESVSTTLAFSQITNNRSAGIMLDPVTGLQHAVTDTRITHSVIRENMRGIAAIGDGGSGGYVSTGWITNNLIESNNAGSGTFGSASRLSAGIHLKFVQKYFIENNYFEFHLNDVYVEDGLYYSTFRNNYHDGGSTHMHDTYAADFPISGSRKIAAYWMQATVNADGNTIENDHVYEPTRRGVGLASKWGARTLVNNSMSVNTNIVTASAGNYTSADVGREIQVPTAGAGATTLTTFIETLVDVNTVTTRDFAAATATNQTATIGETHITFPSLNGFTQFRLLNVGYEVYGGYLGKPQYDGTATLEDTLTGHIVRRQNVSSYALLQRLENHGVVAGTTYGGLIEWVGNVGGYKPVAWQWVHNGSGGSLQLRYSAVIGTPGSATMIEATNLDKLGFFGASPVVRPTSTTDLRQSLIDVGLYTTGGATPLDLNGGTLTSLYDRFGAGSPEGVVTAPVSAVYHRTDGGAGTSVYFKESGAGNTGWVAK